MRFAICNETFQGWAWDETCAKVAELGYDAIEVAPFTLAADVRTLDAAQRTAIRLTAEANGLAVTGLHWLLVSPEGLSLTCDDAEIRAATGAYLASLVDFCADLGGSVMVLGSPKQRRIAPGSHRDEALSRMADALRAALDRAERAGIVVCLEPLPAPESDLVLTLDEAAAVIGSMSHSALRTIFDVKSASAETPQPSDLAIRYSRWIAHVHANDANRRGPGFGDTDFGPILRALNQIGYDGYVSVEVFDYSPDPVTIARESLRYLQGCLKAAG
ncbi:MAG: sugar phosphate isomerase/epimerase [Armatimonadetes bacterium]|nr:sugar phosphate isomerase/epimerase [Armatimonadota bacterium]